MTVTGLLPTLKNLSRADKLRIMQFLVFELAKEEEAIAKRCCEAQIATSFSAELEDEQAWKNSFESTKDEQWDSLAQMVRQEIVAGDITPLDDVFPPKS
ncbi:hypothetical protein [Lyngbya aestuarii]|uniref:hypothetical protein n=1 Tax=Lyngbya aestuarii TaxID=118322 RepID=UPI00403DEEF0